MGEIYNIIFQSTNNPSKKHWKQSSLWDLWFKASFIWEGTFITYEHWMCVLECPFVATLNVHPLQWSFILLDSLFVIKDRFNMCFPTQLLSCFIFTLFTGVSGSFMHRFIMFFQVTMMRYLFHNIDRCVLFPSPIMIWLFWSS